MPIRQKEIAKKTGFSLSVVSRALSSTRGKSNTLSEATRKAVRKAAEAMGYKPNLQASCLRKGKQPVIGVFIPDWGGDLVSKLVMGISNAALEKGVPLSFCFNMSLSAYGNFIDAMKDQGSSGILSYVPKLNDSPDETIMKKLEAYRKAGGSVVLLNTFSHLDHGFPHVSVDEAEGGRLAARFLASQGCSQYASVHCSARIYMSRANGFFSALPNGADAMPFMSGATLNDRQGLEKTVNALFDSIKKGKLLGVFAVTDMVARHLIWQGRKRGFVHGQDFLVVGYDEPPHGPDQDESVRIIQPFREIGLKGFMKLSNLIDGKREGAEILKPTLKIKADPYVV